MHELSIATAIVAEVARAAEENAIATVNSVTVRVGRLSGVVAGALQYGFEIAAHDTALAGAELVVDDEPVTVWCPDGDHTVILDELIFRCPDHGCPTPEVIAGESLEIVRFTGDDADPAGDTAPVAAVAPTGHTDERIPGAAAHR